MRRLILFFTLFLTIISFSQDKKVNVPDLLKIKFNEEFKNAINPTWSKVYRGELDTEARYEVAFYMDNSRYLVSYNNDGNIRVIARSLSLEKVKKESLLYIKNMYPKAIIVASTQKIKEDNKVFYEITISNRGEYLELLFSEDGSFLEKKILK